MIYFRLLLGKHYWTHYFRIGKLVTALLASYGTLFTVTKIIGLFDKNLDQVLSDKYIYFIVFGLVLAYVQTVPRLSISRKLKDRDITIEIVVKDFFKIRGDRIVGSNTTFDTDVPAVISAKSIQGQFQVKYYPSISHLDFDIQAALAGVESVATSKKVGKTLRFDVGTVAKLVTTDSTNYFVALATISDRAVASATVEDLKVSLAKLWYFISKSGTIDPLVCPVLGSGFSRLSLTREEIILEIVNSFVASCSDSKYTEKLTIAVHPNDFLKHEIDFKRLSAYLDHITTYVTFKNGSQPPVGTSIS